MKENSREQQIVAIDRGLREAHRLKKYLMADIARDAGDSRMNATHYRTLLILSRFGAAAMKTLCSRIGLEAGSFTPVADRLIEEGLVERRQDEKDRRRILLSLTPSGEAAVGRVKGIIAKHLDDKLSVLDDNLLSSLADSMILIARVNEILQGTSLEENR